MSVRYAISGGEVVYISTTIVRGDDSNKQYDKEIIKKYDSGNFIADWYKATEYMIRYMKTYDVAFSRGIDDYIHLSNKYTKVYLKKYGSQWILSKDINDGYIFYVNKGTNPTSVELKQLCSDEKE